MLQQTGSTLIDTELDVTLRTEGRVGSDGDVVNFGELHKAFLGQVRVELDLKYSGWDTSISQNIQENTSLKVTVHRKKK